MARVTGAKAHAARIKRIAGQEMVRQVGAALMAGGSLLATEAQISITNANKTGRIYTEEFRTINGRAVPVGKRADGKAHQASAPGEAPANDTQHLADNIETVLVEPLKVEVSSNAKYSRHLEYGTSKMAARPFMAPALARTREEIVNLVQSAVKKIVAGGKVVP